MFALRAQYLTRFGAVTGVTRCVAHDGEFREGEVERLGSPTTPAVFVACLGMPEVLDQAGPLEAMLAWSAFVLTRRSDAVKDGFTAGDYAATIALAIAFELTRGAMFSEATTPAAKLRVQNLFGTSATLRGYTLWAVTWRQATEVTPEGLAAVLEHFRTFHTDYDLPPTEGIDTSTTTTLETLES